jgi:catechol 2,3-dioxygenase-like lactoylglutathione lyase family enzyme
MTTALPFAVQRLDHVVLRVTDLPRAIEFYARVLGCAVALRNDARGLVHLRAGASMIDLVDVHGPIGQQGGAAAAADNGRNMDHLCLRIEPFDEAAVLAHLAAHDVPRSSHAKQQYGAEGTGPAVYLQDPDGNTIELKGPAHRATGDTA